MKEHDNWHSLTSSVDSTIDPVALFYAHFEALHFVSGLSNQGCHLVNSHSQSIIFDQLIDCSRIYWTREGRKEDGGISSEEPISKPFGPL